ncbi:MAG: hypothetical protein JWP65_2164 [Ramlibacter sp.]|jgi:Ni/Co efflux regulator RcnB|uniref:RcnB family protein n=1 Tax=Ramlibacter sp. TaxID=1917967 RepID=UPI0026109C5F|nr:RcnB family protein [Ramlibacter sp.]MDB5751743.1 hypothetical protein [Ramlibacter sp.]
MRTSILPAVLLLAAFLAAPALAEKPDHPGGGKHADKHERKADKHQHKAEKHERKADKHGHGPKEKHAGYDDGQPRRGAYFDDTHRNSVHRYYTTHSRANCPPGLAKKNNGCLPRGQAKKWEVGHRVPQGVTVYTVPQPILVTLPPPPPRHRYVRVAGDILLIAVGTQMVVDGISGLAN